MTFQLKHKKSIKTTSKILCTFENNAINNNDIVKTGKIKIRRTSTLSSFDNLEHLSLTHSTHSR